jgi:hypothetical protein
MEECHSDEAGLDNLYYTEHRMEFMDSDPFDDIGMCIIARSSNMTYCVHSTLVAVAVRTTDFWLPLSTVSKPKFLLSSE